MVDFQTNQILFCSSAAFKTPDPRVGYHFSKSSEQIIFNSWLETKPTFFQDFLRMLLNRYAFNNTAFRCVTFSLHMLKRPSSLCYQAVSYIHSFEKSINNVPIPSIKNSISVEFWLRKKKSLFEYLAYWLSFIFINIISIIICCSI